MRELSVLAFALVVLVAPPCRAEETSGLQLTWTAPATCPNGTRVSSETASLSGSRPTRSLVVDAAVDEPRSPGAPWTVVLRAQPEDGASWSRTLRAATCVELARVAALVLSLASERNEGEPVSEAAPAVVVSARAPEPEPAEQGASDSIPSQREAPSTTVFVSAGALVDVGTLPSANADVGVGVGLRVRRLRFEASARHHPATQTARDASGRGGEFSESAVAAQACVGWSLGSITVGPCGGAELIAVGATGLGVATPTARTVVLGGPTAGLAVTWRFARHWSLDAALRGLALVRRPAFALEPSGVVHRPAALVGLSALAVQLDF
ncbi:MAG: hypothetical protein JWM74_2028 [Myxococcaceae bacterium]|nr:hypothetical protein [Myxococcaceae bacterium]